VNNLKTSSSKPQTDEARAGDLSDQYDPETSSLPEDSEPARLPTMGQLMSGLRGFRSAKKAEEPTAVEQRQEEQEEPTSETTVSQLAPGAIEWTVEPAERREAVMARERLLDRGITFDMPQRLSTDETPTISGEALRVLASCPQGGFSLQNVSDMLMMDQTQVGTHLTALAEAGLVTVMEADKTVAITDLGVRTVDVLSSQGNSVEATLSLMDLTLAAANRRFAEGSSNSLEILQTYTTALSRPSQPSTRVDALEVALANLQELVWMSQGLGAAKMPEGFDDLAKRLSITFPDAYQPMVAPHLRKMAEVQGLFKLASEFEGRTGQDLVDFASKTSTYGTLNAGHPSLSTLKTASLLALNALQVDAGGLGERTLGLGASANNAARITGAIIDGAGQGARPWSYTQFQTLLDPAVGALAATSQAGQEFLGERIRFTRRESRTFLADLSRPVLNQFEGNVDVAMKVLTQVAEQIRVPLAESEQIAFRADLNEIKRMDGAMKTFTSSLANAFLQQPSRAQELARTVSVEASAAGVDGALRLYTFLANAHSGDLLEDLSMACLAARTLASDSEISPKVSEAERAEASAFARVSESFLIAVGRISPLYDPTLNETLRENLRIFVANKQRIKNPSKTPGAHEVAHLRDLMTPQGQPGIWASTPENHTYQALNIAQFLDTTGLQRPEIRSILAVRGLLAWANGSEPQLGDTTGSSADANEGDALLGRVGLISNPVEMLGNLGIQVGLASTPTDGWTKRSIAHEVANNPVLTGSDGSIWLQGNSEAIFMSWSEASEASVEACSEALLAAAANHKGKITLAIHTEAPGFEALADRLRKAGHQVQLADIGNLVALATAEEQVDLASDAELAEADQIISRDLSN